MSDFERYEALMLEHLYGLLEGDEARELETFLATPAGAELRARAERWKSQLTSASRSSFPEVRFSPPVQPKVKPNNVKPSESTAPVSVKSIGMRWAVAASL